MIVDDIHLLFFEHLPRPERRKEGIDNGVQRALVDGKDIFDLAALVFGDGRIFLALAVEERDFVSLRRHTRCKLLHHDLHAALTRRDIFVPDHDNSHAILPLLYLRATASKYISTRLYHIFLLRHTPRNSCR